ncbi:hypothetical protein ACLOJK_018788 [Asimina triloba]
MGGVRFCSVVGSVRLGEEGEKGGVRKHNRVVKRGLVGGDLLGGNKIQLGERDRIHWQLQRPSHPTPKTAANVQTGQHLHNVTGNNKGSNKTSFGQLISNFLQQQGSRIPSVK